MKTIRKLLLLCLFGMISMGIYATEWQTWTGKGCIVDTYDSPAPSDDSNGNHWYSEEYDDSQWADISGPIESFKEGGAYYVRRIVELPDDYNNRSYLLRVNSDDESAYYIVSP